MNSSLEFYKRIFTSATVGLVVCDESGKCIEANEAIGRIIGGTREDVLAQNCYHMKSWEGTGLPEAITVAHKTKENQHIEISLTTSLGRQVSLDFNIMPFAEKEQIYLLFVVYDITKRKQAEKANEALIEKLQKAIAEIRTLQGFIPICMHCKQIRDDEGYWHRVETYIEKHSNAKFSHGICPGCFREKHPEHEEDND